MIIRSNEYATFIFENDAIVTHGIAKDIIHTDIQIMHREIGSIIENGIQGNDWGGDDTFFDYSPAIINAYHAMLMAIHSEDNMVMNTTLDESLSTDGIDYNRVLLTLFEDDAFMSDITTMLADVKITIQSFMFDASFIDELDDRAELSVKRTQFIFNHYAKGD